MSEVIILKDFDNTLKEFMSMPNSIIRNIVYYNNIMNSNFYQSNVCKKDNRVHYSVTCYTVKKSKESYYLKSTSKTGLTIDEKGKLKVWFGKSVNQIIHQLKDLFDYYNYNWLNEKLTPYITKSILEKIFSGKITNNTDLVKEYFKVMRIKASPALFLKASGISKEDNNYKKSYLDKTTFLSRIQVAKNIDDLLKMYPLESSYNDESFTLHLDMEKEAKILGKKIDYTWSTARLKEEHKQWTMLIMEEEVKSMSDVSIPNVDVLDKFTPKGFKLLKSQKEVFQEGKIMSHCIYTAYWREIKDGRYLAYHIVNGNEEATLGINIKQSSFEYSQCYSKYNRHVSVKMRTKAENFVNELNYHLKGHKQLFTNSKFDFV